MTAKEIKIKQEDKGAASDYLKKAADNYEQMLRALENNNYNAAATLAIQCAISSADALCVFERGIRSVSDSHLDVCQLIESITLPEAKEKAKVLRKVISKKNMVQYEKRNIFQSEAHEIVKQTSRFYHWVKSRLPRE
jgi:HEPN domain-containing protein